MQSFTQDNFKVLIRVRPLNSRQKQEINAYEQLHSKRMKGSSGKMLKMTPAVYSFYTKFYNCNIDEIIKINKKSNTISVADQEYKNTDRKMKPFTYSGVYDLNDMNKTIFQQDLQNHVTTVLQGFNCTILAYGITGSGKTYTVFGPSSKKQNSTPNSSNFNTFNANASSSFEEQVQGISYLTFQFLLKQKHRLWALNNTKVSYKLSFIQIYNENARDLLTETSSSNKFLNIVEDNKGNTTVSDVIEVSIESIEQVYHYINLGNAKRAFASTMANQYSSRSHAILQLMVETQKPGNQKTCSKLYIIDLAGSQKLQSLNCSKKMQQGANINKSLLALGNCINTLAENSRKNIVTHIPYRDSKLTRMLKDSLGGNTKTIMIACISPNPFLIQQTMTTLNYAMRAQGIKKKIMKNQVEGEKDQKLEYLCLKCKKSSKLQNEEEIQTDDGCLKERSSSLSNLPFPLTLIRNQNKQTDQKIQILQSLYEDIVNNAREQEALKNFANNNTVNDPEWMKLISVNEQQKNKLKQVLFNLFKKQKKTNFSTKGVTSKNYEVEQPQNKQNQDSCSTQNKGSLSGSKSRRRRSHGKFQVVRKSDSECKVLDFD